MATGLHRDLPDAELHEPKGIVAAGAGEVYAADGAGGGSWGAPDAETLQGNDVSTNSPNDRDLLQWNGTGSEWEPAEQALPKNWIRNLKVSWVSNSQVAISAGEARSDDDTDNLKVTSAITPIDITTSGANGLDTGSEASNTWYYIWVIKNPTGPTYAGLLSTSATSPTLPSGYTKKRLVGTVYNTGASNFRNFRVVGSGSYRVCHCVGTNVLLLGGTATVWTPISCAAAIPPVATRGLFQIVGLATGVSISKNIDA